MQLGVQPPCWDGVHSIVMPVVIILLQSPCSLNGFDGLCHPLVIT